VTSWYRRMALRSVTSEILAASVCTAFDACVTTYKRTSLATSNLNPARNSMSTRTYITQPGAMDPSRMMQLLDAQRQSLQAAKQRKGQRATNKPSRRQLLFQFSHMVSTFSSYVLYRS
jgi:hypothetical protein